MGLAFVEEAVKAGGEGIAVNFRGAAFNDDMTSGGDLLEDLNMTASALYSQKGGWYMLEMWAAAGEAYPDSAEPVSAEEV